MNDKVIIVTRDDKHITLKEWQEQYGLPVGSEQIGKYFSLNEPKFKQDLRDYGKLYVNALLVQVMDAVREAWGKPLKVNSFNRNDAKQAALRAEGLRAATTSPHVVYLAVDLDTTSVADSRKLAKLIQAEGKKLKIVVRVGVEDYVKAGQTFVHFDVCPEYYGKSGTRYKHPHPRAWEAASVW
jgi:hypothetical protein